MTTPEGYWGGPRLNTLEAEVRQLKAEVDALRNRGGRNSGALSIKAPNGSTTFASGPTPDQPLADGTPQWITAIRDMTGLARLTMWDPNPLVDGFVQALYMWDHLGQIVWTTDNNGGWAEPWFSVVMYAKFAPPAGVYQYMNTPTNVAEQTLWTGIVPYVSHPRIAISGLWGQASGSNSTRYRLKLGGVTLASWDVGGLTNDTRGPFDIASMVNDRDVSIDLTAQTLSGSGNYACQINGCYLRQT